MNSRHILFIKSFIHPFESLICVIKMKSLFKRSRALWMAILSVAVVCTLLLLSQTAFALNTYVITDGDRVVIVTSSATDPAEILNEAGLRLGEDDTYTTLPGIGLSEITIRRSGMSVTIDNRGEILEVNTKHETVGELLAWLKQNGQQWLRQQCQAWLRQNGQQRLRQQCQAWLRQNGQKRLRHQCQAWLKQNGQQRLRQQCQAWLRQNGQQR